jgi:hypothetical protein
MNNDVMMINKEYETFQFIQSNNNFNRLSVKTKKFRFEYSAT